MTIDTLFGPEIVPTKPRNIKLRTIKAVYETLTVIEDITNYLKPGTRFTALSKEGYCRMRTLIVDRPVFGVFIISCYHGCFAI